MSSKGLAEGWIKVRINKFMGDPVVVAESLERLLDQHAAEAIYLPKITDEIAEDFPELISFEGAKPDWSQLAVDFACLLKQSVSVRMEKSDE